MIGIRVQKSQKWKNDIRRWAELAKNKKAHVIGDSVREVFELATSTQPSVMVTGTYEEGFIPWRTGELAESQQVVVDGSVVATGLGSPQAVPERVTQRMNISLEFTAEYAGFVEYGTKFMGGRFFVTGATQQWIPIVESAVARYVDN